MAIGLCAPVKHRFEAEIGNIQGLNFCAILPMIKESGYRLVPVVHRQMNRVGTPRPGSTWRDVGRLWLKRAANKGKN
jgi:hypothetical protein